MYLTGDEFISRVGENFVASLVAGRLGEHISIDDEPAKQLLYTTLTYASDVIDTYLMKVYVVPLANCQEVKYFCEIIALEMLFSHTDEENTKKYQETIEQLKALSLKKSELKNCPKKRIKTYK